jgi:hypothetical protein
VQGIGVLFERDADDKVIAVTLTRGNDTIKATRAAAIPDPR